MPLSKLSRKSFFLVILMAAAGARMVHFTAADLWQDEVNEIFICRGSLSETWQRIRLSEMRPPLRYYFLKAWLFGGRNTHYLRLPSFLFSVLAVGWLYFVSRRLLDEEVARTASLLMAFASFPVSSAQFCRSYSMDAFLALLAVHAFLKWRQERASRARLFFIATAVLATWTTYFFLFVLGLMLAWELLSLKLRALKGKAFLATFLPVALLCAPLIPLALEQFHNARQHQWHAAGADFYHLLEYFYAFGSGRIKNWDYNQWLGFLALLCFFFAIVGAWAIFQKDAETGPTATHPAFALAWFALPTLLIFAFSLISIGLFTIRAMILFAPAYYLLVACGIHTIHPPRAGACLLALLAAGNLAGFATTADLRYITNGSRKAAVYIETHWKPGEKVIHADHFTYFPLRFYAPSLEHSILLAPVPWNWGAAQVPPEHLRKDLSDLRTGPGFWFVKQRAGYQVSMEIARAQEQMCEEPWRCRSDGRILQFRPYRRLRIGNLSLIHYLPSSTPGSKPE